MQVKERYPILVMPVQNVQLIRTIHKIASVIRHDVRTYPEGPKCAWIPP